MTGYEKYCKLRDEAKLNDAEVARRVAIPKSTFSDWKSGRSKPKSNKLIRIAAFFQVSPSSLLDDGEIEDAPVFTLPYQAFVKLCADNGKDALELGRSLEIDGYDFIDWQHGDYARRSTLIRPCLRDNLACG